MKSLVITQSNYIPWKGYFDSINTVDEVILYDDMQYTRRDWRNRNIIKTKDGLKWLTIPVEVKGKYFQKINETKISDHTWAEQHWNTIKHSYAKAPFFKDFATQFETLYAKAEKEGYLSHVNHLFLKGICDLLGIQTPLLWSSDFALVEGKTERLVDLCKQRNATAYYSGPRSKEYMDESLFQSASIAVNYFDYSGYQPYSQLHGNFEHGVSIIDLILNEGLNARKYMKSFSDVNV